MTQATGSDQPYSTGKNVGTQNQVMPPNLTKIAVPQHELSPDSLSSRERIADSNEVTAHSGQFVTAATINPSARDHITKKVAWLVGVAALTLGLCVPFRDTVFWLGDEGVLLHGAERLLQGKKLYLEFFEFLPPGGFLITAAWLKVFGISFLSARSLTIILITGISCLIFLSCSSVTKRSYTPAAVAIAWVIMSQGEWTQLNHHWFTTLLSMLAAWAAIACFDEPRARCSWPAIAGLSASAAAMVTPTRGALVMTAAALTFILLRKKKSEATTYLIACGIVPTCILLYLVRNETLVAGFNDVIVFTATRYPQIQGVPFAHETSLLNYPLALVFPVTILMFIILALLQRWMLLLNQPALPCLVFGLAGFAGCYPRPDIAHIIFAVPLVMPTFIFCIDSLVDKCSEKTAFLMLTALLLLCAPAIFSFIVLMGIASDQPRTQMARGAIANLSGSVDDSGIPAWRKLTALTEPGSKILFYPYMPLLPFLSAREHVAKYDIFVPEYTLPSQYRSACVDTMRDAKWALIGRYWSDPGKLRKAFPSMKNPEPMERRQFEEVINKGFTLVASSGSYELRMRTDAATPDLCTSIGD